MKTACFSLHNFEKPFLAAANKTHNHALEYFDIKLSEKTAALAKNFPEHPLMDDVLFEKAMIYLQQKDYEKTIALFDKVEENYSSDLLADDAMFKLADLFETQLHQKDKAMDLYKSILTKYPGSLYVIEARKRFRALRGDILN